MAIITDTAIAENWPQNLTLPKECVEQILFELGYELIPCGQVSSSVKITTLPRVEGKWVRNWGLKDLEKKGYKVYRQNNGGYAVFSQDEDPNQVTGTYVPIEEAQALLGQAWYQIYTPFIRSGEFQIAKKSATSPKWHVGHGFACFQQDLSVEVGWLAKADNQTITYTPVIMGSKTKAGKNLPKDLQQALLKKTQAQTVTVKVTSA